MSLAHGLALFAGAAALLLTLFAWRLYRQLQSERRQAAAHLLEREALVREQAIAGERVRIHGDLHDDLGAGLLSLVHNASSPQEADHARALLQNLRDVVSHSRGTPGTLTEVLGEIFQEARQRLAAAAIELDWQGPQEMPDARLDGARALHLYRIVREAISNVIRHAEAQQVRVRIAAGIDSLDLELTDDGHGGGDLRQPAQGRGVENMRERTSQLAGKIDWRKGTVGGTKILLSVPLEGAP